MKLRVNGIPMNSCEFFVGSFISSGSYCTGKHWSFLWTNDKKWTVCIWNWCRTTVRTFSETFLNRISHFCIQKSFWTKYHRTWLGWIPGFLEFLNTVNETWIWKFQIVELQKSFEMIPNSNHFLRTEPSHSDVGGLKSVTNSFDDRI